MSIRDSAAELQVAELKVGSASDEELQRDLAFWTVASYDSSEQFREVSNRLGELRLLHSEEELWVSLIALEIRKRRDEKRATAAG